MTANDFRKAREYLKYLKKINEVTDNLSLMIRDPELNGIEEALQSREILCTRLSECSPGLTALANGTNQEARSLAKQIENLHDSLLNKQTECEQQLMSRMKECKAEIGSARKEKGLHQAYNPKASKSASVYMDNRL